MRFIFSFLIYFSFSLSLFAQVPVHEEVYHKPVFTIPGEIRVINLVLPPGDTSAFHIHSHNMWFYTLQGTQMWLQTPQDTGRKVKLPTGFQKAYLDYAGKPFTHRIANLGLDTLHVIAVENLLSSQVGRKMKANGRFALHESSDFEVYLVEMKAWQRKKWWFAAGCLFVLCEDGKLSLKENQKDRKRISRRGDWYWSSPGATIIFKNKKLKKLKVLIVRMKNSGLVN